MYTVSMYEKDGDVYTDMATTLSFARAISIAKALYRLCLKEGIKRHDTGEPYDYPVIFDKDDNAMLTLVYPEM